MHAMGGGSDTNKVVDKNLKSSLHKLCMHCNAFSDLSFIWFLNWFMDVYAWRRGQNSIVYYCEKTFCLNVPTRWKSSSRAPNECSVTPLIKSPYLSIKKSVRMIMWIALELKFHRYIQFSSAWLTLHTISYLQKQKEVERDAKDCAGLWQRE